MNRGLGFVIDSLEDVPCDGEEDLMVRIRRMAGPWASDDKLRCHLRSARGKLHWAINSYMRICLSDEGTRLDYEPRSGVLFRPCAATSSDIQSLAIKDNSRESGDAQEEDPGSLDAWAPTLVSLLLEQISDPWTLISASRVSRAFYKETRNEKLWKDLFDSKWPVVFPLSKAKGQGASSASPLRRTIESFRDQSLFIHRMSCPVCGEDRGIVPIVYGYPSVQLMEKMRKKMCILGGDHLVEECFVWGCHQCNESFKVHPFSPPFDWILDVAKDKSAKIDGMRAYTYEL